MGQCASNKAKGNLNVKKILSQKKLKKKMDKNKDSDDKDEKKPQKFTKGTAMSFGFKRRPTPMVTSTSTVAWDNGDSNGNNKKDSTNKTHKTSSQTPKPSISRFNFSQTNSERTNKVADIKNKQPTNQEPLTRNVTIITRTHVTETSRTNNEDRAGCQHQTNQDREGCHHQTGKFMFQTTRLPQPEPIRLIETKTAKTIANNNRRMWNRQQPMGREICYSSGGEESMRLQDCNRFSSFLENLDACTPPPLPELPSVFGVEKRDNDDKEETRSQYSILCKKSFMKNERRNILDSPQSSSDQDYLYGGEAMADDLSLNLSPKNQLDSLNLSFEDANFSALVTNNKTVALLDDEILSPVESLLSSSETTEEINKNKTKNSSSNSKDVNEKLTPPGSPSNTASLSLSDDKEDFLIDDEIADQPELLFEEGNQSASKNKRSSFDSLSPASDSFDSGDLMCDYDLSQSNEFDVWDKQSAGSYTSSPRSKFKLDDSSFNNKNFFKNLTPKHSNSPNFYKSSPVELRSPKRSPFGSDPPSESLAMTKANHAAIQHDIIGIRTMLMTLKRVLNDSSEEPFSFNSNINNNNEFKLELADLRRQVIFLQGQLEDKEKTVNHLQRQIGDLATQNTHTSLDNASVDVQNRCNAATQTERARPASGGMFSLTTTPIEDINNPILRFMVK